MDKQSDQKSRLERQLEFIREIDKEKEIIRQSYSRSLPCGLTMFVIRSYSVRFRWGWSHFCTFSLHSFSSQNCRKEEGDRYVDTGFCKCFFL